jgi:hypothetical protein
LHRRGARLPEHFPIPQDSSNDIRVPKQWRSRRHLDFDVDANLCAEKKMKAASC